MYELVSTQLFDKWLKSLKDRSARNRVLARLVRIENGNFGDNKKLSSDLFELRFFFHGGLRIYYSICDGKVVLLLCGGDKSSQKRDIEKAEQLLSEWRTT